MFKVGNIVFVYDRVWRHAHTVLPSISTLWSLKLTNYMAQEPEGSSPHSQQPATGPCPETVKSNPHPPSQSP
jgi:hypothetical protein